MEDSVAGPSEPKKKKFTVKNPGKLTEDELQAALYESFSDFDTDEASDWIPSDDNHDESFSTSDSGKGVYYVFFCTRKARKLF